LRREEVAILANVSSTWYTYLEQGRKIRPSAEVVDSLADALRLTHAERRYLHALGVSTPASVMPRAALDPDAVSVVRGIVNECNASPYPVYAADHVGDLVAWNGAMAEWYTDFSALEGRARNVLRWLFTAPEARRAIENWADDARDIVSRIRFYIAMGHADPKLEAVVRDLHAASDEFAAWWSTHDVSDQDARLRIFRHPTRGRSPLQLAVVRPVINPSASIVFHLPVDESQDPDRAVCAPS
jgi:transcriptional regulator with XRE-family HTH domain